LKGDGYDLFQRVLHIFTLNCLLTFVQSRYHLSALSTIQDKAAVLTFAPLA